MAAKLYKICFCIITLLCVTMASAANDTMPAEKEIPYSSSSPPPPENGGDASLSSSDASEYSPPPSIDALATEEAEQLNLSPNDSPSPAPYFTQYPSPPPYVEVEAPEVYELYTPTQAPAPEPSVFGSEPLSDTEPRTSSAEAPEVYELYTPTQVPAPEPSSVFASEPLSDTEPSTGSPDSNMAPNPTVVPSNYRAEDESVDFDDEYYSSEQSKNRVTMVGFVLGAVCVVGFAGIVFNKKKYNKSKADYDYELAKREDF